MQRCTGRAVASLSRSARQSNVAATCLRPRSLATTTQLRSIVTARHTLQPRLALSRHAITLPTTQTRSLWIQTESTPNADALKFVPAGQQILPDSVSGTIEYLSGREAHGSPLARKLFAVDGVSSVFFGRDFVTVTKGNESSWHTLKPEIFALLMEHLTAGEPVLSDVGAASGVAQDTAINEDDDEVVSMIKELLDTRIRPSIQEDGGDIEYRGFVDGVVQLKLRGACRTCDSSTVTLKNGIESMLMHYVPEVEAVEQVLDPEEQMANDTFAEFEKNLQAKRKMAESMGAPAI